mgnify:CR=1 FL=1
MALIVVGLVEATPYRLRYLVDQNGVVSSPPNQLVDGTVVIPNDGGATPDLRTDANPFMRIREVMRARLDGLGQLPAGVALTQAAARALLDSVLPESVLPGNRNTHRCVLQVTPTKDNSAIAWGVDANVDAQGDPVIVVASSIGLGLGQAYVDVVLRHSFDL